MEEKRMDTGNQPAANPTTETPAKAAETPVAEPTSTRRRGGGQKRKASNLSSGNSSNPSTSLSAKRQAREKITAVPFPPIHNGPLTRARLQPNNGGGAPGLDSSTAAIVSVGQLVESSGGGAVKVEESSSIKEDFEALEAKIEAEYEVIRSRDANAHVVPIPSGWFSWTKVHPLEERALPSFFNGKSKIRTPEIYMEIRNWIMSKFHTNPNTQVKLKDLSEISIGDLEARQEVMEFLDYWGLINYHPFPAANSSALAVAADEVDEGTKPSSLVEKLYRFETEESCASAVSRINVATPTVPSKLFTDSTIAEELAGPEGPPEYHCNSCAADCSRKRYHCQKQADFDLCSECFSSGKFGSYMSPSDFILMEPAEAAGATGGKWTDQETLLLLEALELYKENWSEIAEHVATKTKTQCILHFVQMPIEDTFLDCDDDDAEPVSDPVPTVDEAMAPKDAAEAVESKDGESDNQPLPAPVEVSKEDTVEVHVSKENVENCAVKALKDAFEAVGSLPSDEGKLSFAEAGNPVMALAAFLVRLADPTNITAAAHNSLKLISASDSNIQLAARHCFLLEDPPSDDKKSANSERDTPEMIEQDVLKDEKSNSSKDQDNDKNKDSVTKEEILVSSNDEGAKESGAPAPQNESDNPDLVKEQAPSTVEESTITESSTKGPGDGGSVGPSQLTEAPKDEEMVSDPSEKKEPEQPIASNLAEENAANTVDEEAKDTKNETEDPMETKNDIDIDKVKRAAITAISAAAVKAKLLATQEEDQIRELATSLIEKQLHKLETKLSFFNEMENVVMRAREQLERSKQKLFQERSQIIAARLGISAASSARPAVQPSLPVNRAAMAFANSAQRPPIGMMTTSLRPTISRPVMAAAVPPSSLVVPTATVAGSSLPASNQDNVS